MKRRDFLALSLAQSSVLSSQSSDSFGAKTQSSVLSPQSFVEGIKVGHFTETRRPTGCTVFLTEEGAVGGVDQRGGAPGTRDTELLNPVNSVSHVHAVVLSGGSAFGLAAADGVVRYLEEKGVGFAMGQVHVPIVPAAILFDLGVGDPKIRPTAESGYKACQAATSKVPEQGNVGAGAGATIGKMLGMDRAMKGGFGTASIRLPDGLVVGAGVAVNARGDIWDYRSGKLLAGARTEDGKRLADVMSRMRRGTAGGEARPTNTTIGVVATNAVLTKPQATKMAQLGNDGLALAIRPAHTAGDGDTVFSLATGKLRGPVDGRRFDQILALAADVMAQAIVSAILHAKGIPGFPGVGDL